MCRLLRSRTCSRVEARLGGFLQRCIIHVARLLDVDELLVFARHSINQLIGSIRSLSFLFISCVICRSGCGRWTLILCYVSWGAHLDGVVQGHLSASNALHLFQRRHHSFHPVSRFNFPWLFELIPISGTSIATATSNSAIWVPRNWPNCGWSSHDFAYLKIRKFKRFANFSIY